MGGYPHLPMPLKRKSVSVPSFVRGRKGQTSVIDCLVELLWKGENDDAWPARTFNDLRERVSKMQGYHVTSSTIRSSVYDHSDLFERAKTPGQLRWRLTKQARKGSGAGS